MFALSALLARDGVVPHQKIDEAIQRQVINGGDFETNLLEIDAIAEDTLAAYCAAMHDMLPVRRDELAHATPDAIAKIPRELAEANGVVPVRFEGGRLLIATAGPLSDTAIAALQGVTGAAIDVRVTCGFRIAWALAKIYGADIEPRLQRLARKLEKRPSGTMPGVTSNIPRASHSPSAGIDPSPYTNRIPASALAALTAILEDDRTSLMPDPPRIAEPDRRPAMTFDEAKQRIALGESRDPILETMLEFAADRVAYAAFFVVHGDVAEGLMARGTGVTTAAVRGIAVPLEAQGTFHDVRERGEPILGSLNRGGTDPMVKEDLGRKDAVGVAIVPIFIANRVALLAWFDGGSRALDLDAINAIVKLAGEAAHAFERIIVERKRKTAPVGHAVIPVPAEPTIVTRGDIAHRVAEQRGAQALRALAVSETKRDAGTAAAEALNVASGEPNAALSTRGVFAAPDAEVARSLIGAPPPDAAPARPPPLPPSAAPAQPAAAPSAAVQSASYRPPSVPPPAGGSSATAFARGGRRAIAVDVVGPLPDLATTPRRRSARPPAARTSPDAGFMSDTPIPRNPTDLVAEIVRSKGMSDAVAHALLGGGERALEAVFKSFPGPVTFDRLETRARVPPVQDMGPLLRLAVMFRAASAPYLIERLESPEPEQRYFATLCLGEVVNAGAIARLMARVFDTDFPTRVAAVEVLRAYRRFGEFDQVVRTLRNVLGDSATAVEKRRVAANALGELRDTDAIPALIAVLTEPDQTLSSLAQRALVTLARQDFGTNAAQWYDWWERNSNRHRIEWLIEGLLHNDATIRHESSEELKKLTGQFFGYYFNLPRRERERAYQRYRDWWEGDGRARYER